jgi:hypothetical protein
VEGKEGRKARENEVRSERKQLLFWEIVEGVSIFALSIHSVMSASAVDIKESTAVVSRMNSASCHSRVGARYFK